MGQGVGGVKCFGQPGLLASISCRKGMIGTLASFVVDTGYPFSKALAMTQPATHSEQIEMPPTIAVPITRSADGTLRVTGTRIPIDRIVHAYLQGQTAEQFCQDFPSVSFADVHAVIAYYLQNRDLIDGYLRRREHEASELRKTIEQELPLNGLRERLLKHREDLKARSEALR